MNQTDMLLSVQNQGKMVELYTHADDLATFAAGMVLAMSNDHLILSSITESGAYDGFVLLPLDSILMQATDTQYLKKLKRLQAKDAFPAVDFPNTERLDHALLAYAARRHLVVSVELLNSGYYDCRGLIREVDPDDCLMEAVTTYGEFDGKRLFPLKNITKIACDTSDEQILARLIEEPPISRLDP